MLDHVATILYDDASLFELSLYCNNPDLAISLEAVLTSLQQLIASALSLMYKALDLSSCGRIAPLYSRVVHEGACAYLPEALYWLLVSTVILATTGTLALATVPTRPTTTTHQEEEAVSVNPENDLSGKDSIDSDSVPN